MKRPLGILAAAILSLGLLGYHPARVATSHSPAAVSHPANDGELGIAPLNLGGDRLFDDDDDDDGYWGGKSKCKALIAICLG